MKKIIILVLASFTILSCKEKADPVEPNPVENVEIAVSYLWNKHGLKTDSLLTNNKGNKFFITDMKILISRFYVLSAGDTFQNKNGNFTYTLDKVEQLVHELPDGGYSGFYGFRLGADSLVNITTLPGASPEGSGLRATGMFRNDGMGYNSILLEGRAIDPTDPTDVTGTIPFRYEISSLYFKRELNSGQANFAVTADTQVNLILNIDPWPIFNDFDIVARPTITSDPTNSIDFASAQMFSDSLFIRLF